VASPCHNWRIRVIERTHDKFRWQLADDFAPLFEAAVQAPARVIKESAAKLVTEHRIGSRAFFVKCYRHSAVPFRSFKFWFKPTQAQQEWQLAAALEELGVPIVRHVAVGEKRSAQGIEESVLITEAFEGLPANEASVAPDSIVSFIQQIWRAGVFQQDLHPANLLVHRETGEMRLVDLHGIVVRTTPVASELDLMLAAARMGLPIPVSPELERLSAEMRKRALHERSKRCLKTNRDFGIRQFGEWKWHIRTAAMTPDTEAILQNPNTFAEKGRALKNGRSSTVAGGHGLVLKRYNFKKPLNLLKDLFRGSRARRGFRKAYHLELCGIPTPRVIAAADHRFVGFPTGGYLLMEEIPGATEAGKWNGEARAMAKVLAHSIASVHNMGFRHRDLKESNILFDTRGVPHLIDLDGLQFVGVVTAREVFLNLRRFANGMRAVGKLNRAAVITFLLHYCRERKVRPRALFPRS
jgi:RIO-like serine/threonine protein kinase